VGLSKGNQFRSYPTDEERVECSVGLEATAIEQDAVWRGEGGAVKGGEGRRGEREGMRRKRIIHRGGEGLYLQ